MIPSVVFCKMNAQCIIKNILYGLSIFFDWTLEELYVLYIYCSFEDAKDIEIASFVLLLVKSRFCLLAPSCGLD